MRRSLYGGFCPDFLQDSYTEARDAWQQKLYDDAVAAQTGTQLHLVECDERFRAAYAKAGIAPLVYAHVAVVYQEVAA